ncbi:M14 family zinc carboxypeptidase [Paenibacillus ginsengarvi]|uniref:Peptidase M14 domain-containing protein n=1 Tax=Paenibacillus ginsengarvi TaxID=400777 RepID=A0A3B0CER1_9BACL|nr:M14 family zinc carboxypeptidase [Paenibacillus ginsengarvi]RKN83982.1 hypothetical protein D7M11_15495 [Paenibacillus ginsengarvi]
MGESQAVPAYWRSSLEHIEQTVSSVKRGQADVFARSAGGRDIYAVYYGDKQDFGRKANYNSACGAGDLTAYAHKTKATKPVIAIVGGIHGGELEGVAAVLNLIRTLETGADYGGRADRFLHDCAERFRLVLIPCMNSDGRARIPFDTLVGMPLAEMRYYVQGTWKDGTLCGWPGCKAVHPIDGAAAHLGGYFNDDGINLMHDNFFAPMAKETRGLMELIDRESADATVLLHGGSNSVNHILPTQYVPPSVADKLNRLVDRVHAGYQAKGIPFRPLHGRGTDEQHGFPPSFNLTSALHHASGGLSMTFESNMALDAPGVRYSYEDMLEGHYILFEELLRFMEDGECPIYANGAST